MNSALQPLDSDVIVIAAASTGIGLVTAKMAGKARITIIAAARNANALRTLVSEIEANGGRAAYVVCDVGNEAEVAQEGWPISLSLIHPGRIHRPYNEHGWHPMPMQGCIAA